MVAFWDTSALVPLLVHEPMSETAEERLAGDNGLVAWWGATVECRSALARREREGSIDRGTADAARDRLSALASAWTEVEPTEPVRALAARLLDRHQLRAADALQLAAALVWCEGVSTDRCFLTNDARLEAAARAEGFKTVEVETA